MAAASGLSAIAAGVVVAVYFSVRTDPLAADLAAAETESMSSLIERVRSPGGTTTAAFDCLDAADVRGIFAKAIQAANQRSSELAEVANEGSNQ